jgi:hypothetical protein
VLELPPAWLEAFKPAYDALQGQVKLLLTTYFAPAPAPVHQSAPTQCRASPVRPAPADKPAGWHSADEALALGHKIKPVLLGPVTYLWLGKVKGEPFDRLSPSASSTSSSSWVQVSLNCWPCTNSGTM